RPTRPQRVNHSRRSVACGAASAAATIHLEQSSAASAAPSFCERGSPRAAPQGWGGVNVRTVRTPVQFGSAVTEPTAAEPVSTRTARICPACAQRFSSDARFCPFDGEPLTESARYDPTADPLQGRVIDDRYEILDLIGEGGMGSVYRARHVRLGRSFALKALKRELSVDPELSARFIREAKAAAAISHPNVVQISDFG